MDVQWPPFSVRPWLTVHDSRLPSDGTPWDHDPIAEANISRRLHEMRGLVIGQVAEVESLLFHIGEQTRRRYQGTLPSRPRRMGAGGALQDVKELLAVLALGDEFAAEIEQIHKVIALRNRLVHGVIRIGFSQPGDQGPLEPVVYMFTENDDDRPPMTIIDPFGDDDDWEYAVEIDERDLENHLNKAYGALEAGLSIFTRVDDELPERN
jgi:hypothetical protein